MPRTLFVLLPVVTVSLFLMPAKAVAELPNEVSGEMVINKEVISTPLGLIFLSPTKSGIDFKGPKFYGSASHIAWDEARRELILKSTGEDDFATVVTLNEKGGQCIHKAPLFLWSAKEGFFQAFVFQAEMDKFRRRAKQLSE